MSRGRLGALRALNRYSIVQNWDGNGSPIKEWEIRPRGFSVCLARITMPAGVPQHDVRPLTDAIELLMRQQVPPPGARLRVSRRRRAKGGAS